MTTNDPLANRFGKAWAEVNSIAERAFGMPPAKPKAKPKADTCPDCGEPMGEWESETTGDGYDIPHKKARGCSECCGHMEYRDEREYRAERDESYWMDRMAEKRAEREERAKARAKAAD